MNIFVCFKILTSYDDVSDKEWETCHKENIHFDFIKRAISPYDEAALENALIIKENVENVKITAVTIGKAEDNSNFYKNMFAVGVDEIISATTDSDFTFSYKEVGENLVRLIEGADLILMGSKSADSMNSLTPFVVANKLGLSLIPNVIDFTFSEGEIFVENQVSLGSEIQKLNGKTVLTIGNAKKSYLRMATLREKLRVGDKSASEVEISLEKDENCCPLEINYKKSGRKCEFISLDSNEEIANYLIEKHFKE